jgi:tetratricopeptide (TPR) repeat protein
MTYAEYCDRCQHVAELVDKQKDYAAAVQVLQGLIDDASLPELDRSMMCLNVALVCEKMGHDEHAVSWYEHAASIDRPLMRATATLRKADKLIQMKRTTEAIALYEDLLNEPFLAMSERHVIEHNLAALRAGKA